MDGSSTTSAEALAALAKTAYNLRAAKMYSLASCIMVYYDIFLTLGDEVARIWSQPTWGLITVLWTLNRYLLPVGYIVIIVSFHQRWHPDVCQEYVLYPEALKIVATAAIGVIFIMRVRAIYHKDRYITIFVWMLLLAQIAVKIWAFTDGVPLDLPDELIGCILVGRHHIRIAFTWVAELIFDSVIFILTLTRTLRVYNRQVSKTTLTGLLIRDGVVYFAVIFVANLVNTLIFLFAEPDIKAINASFSTLITCLMVSRLILNLKSLGQAPVDIGETMQIQISKEVHSQVVVSDRFERVVSLAGGVSTTDTKASRSSQARINKESLYEMKELPHDHPRR